MVKGGEELVEDKGGGAKPSPASAEPQWVKLQANTDSLRAWSQNISDLERGEVWGGCCVFLLHLERSGRETRKQKGFPYPHQL